MHGMSEHLIEFRTLRISRMKSREFISRSAVYAPAFSGRCSARFRPGLAAFGVRVPVSAGPLWAGFPWLVACGYDTRGIMKAACG